MRSLPTLLRGLLQRRRLAREVEAELQFHLDMETDANVARGVSPSEARRRAAMDLGGVTQTTEAIRDVRLLAIEPLWQDMIYAVRRIRKQPAFTALAIATLSLGIGVNVAALTVAYSLLVRPLPFTDPSRVVIVNQLFADGGDLGFSPRALQEWVTRLRTVEAVAGYYRRELTVQSGGRVAVVPAAVVTEDFFAVLGTAADAGHTRISLDGLEAVVSRQLLAEVLGTGEPSPVGDLLTVSGTSYSITGVMAPDFAFPADDVAIWIPSAAMKAGTKPQDAGYSKLVARLKPGVTLEQMRDDANRVRLELNPNSRELVSVVALGESIVSGMRRLLIATAIGAFLVLLIACSNVATLLIGRDVSRARELAARAALGASRGQLVRGVFVECGVFAGLAALCGAALGLAALQVFLTQASGTLPGLQRVGVGWPVVGAIAGLVAIAALLSSVVPAWHAARIDFRPFLRTQSGLRPRAWRVREALVVAQIALSCVLLVGAGLLSRTVAVLTSEDHGFQPHHAIEAKVVLSDSVLFDGAARAPFLDGLAERVRGMPGVQHAGFGSTVPPRTPPITISMRVVEDGRDETRLMKVTSATRGYLPALGATFVSGRDFDDGDDRPDAPVVILSESAARFYFRDKYPIDRSIGKLPALLGTTGMPRVIGVVRDIKYEGLDAPAGSAIYVPWRQRPLGSGYLIVRTSGDPLDLVAAVREATRDLDPTVPVPELQPLELSVAASIANRKIRAMPAIGFGALALAVALVGVLATFMALVAEQKRDLAIRLALGASPSRLVGGLIRHGTTLAAIGLALGLGVSAAGATTLSSMLYRVSPFDPWTFVGTALLIGSGALMMTFLASVRMRNVDPLVVLRSD